MKKTTNHMRWISAALLMALSACSDNTQFTEKTISSLTSEKPTETTSEQIAVEAGNGYQGSDDLSQAEEMPSEMPTDVEPSLPEGEAKGGQPAPTQPPSDSPSQNSGQTGGSVMLPKTQPVLFQHCVDRPDDAIVARVYPLALNTQNLPDFASLEPVGDEVCLPQLNISKRSFSEGFPGVDDLIEWFGLDMHFKVNVPSSGNYTLTLSSDDGSLLFIDGKPVIDNDGLHVTRERSAKVYLSAGQHSFHIKYFQGPRYHIALELFWQTPGSSTRTYIPQNLLSRP